MTDFTARIPALIDTLAAQGWVVCDHFLSDTEALALRDEGMRRCAAGEFHRAGVGRSAAQTVRDDIRGDEVRWLDPQVRSKAEQPYWTRIETLQAALNRELFLGIREGEFHYAHYPAGAFYQRHLDRFRDDDKRVISAVCYLNADWNDTHGGHLRFWPDANTPIQPLERHDEHGRYLDILPALGRLILFRADRFWHAVQPATQERWSVTGWMRRG
jgi:SM-20-related protein